MISKKNIFLFTIIFLINTIYSQSNPFIILPKHVDDPSYADWISMPDISGTEYGVYYFRKEFNLEEVPKQFIVNISADNRYKLFVNNNYITYGPAAGDLKNWNFEKIDIADKLIRGKNLIAVQVWNWGDGKGPRQLSARTAFILQGETEIESIVNSNSSWKVISEKAYSPIINTEKTVRQGYIAGVSEKIDGAKYLWNWNSLDYDDDNWFNPSVIGKGAAQGLNTWRGLTPWILKERIIPLMEEEYQKINSLCYVKGIEYDPKKYSGKLNLKIPSRSKVEILLDNYVLTMGYPVLDISEGRGSKIEISYQEALFNADGSKGNRDIWENKVLKGNKDIYLPDGNDNRVFEPLWIRVFRYVKISIETGDSELLVNDFQNRFSAYPLKEKAHFKTNNKTLEEIWNTSWRTARLCALETYMDCPYYEQIQYIGDARIQALISTYIAGDTRLFKNALEQITDSMQPMGLTKSAHPVSGVQIIPPFTLVYILMIHDYMMLAEDPEYVEKFLPNIEFALSWFINKINSNGMLGALPFWNHIDGGAYGFEAGSPPGADEGNSAHMSLLLAHTLDKSVEILSYFGENCKVDSYKSISEKLKRSTLEFCFDEEKGMLAETPYRKVFSQHTNSFAIIAGLFNDDQNKILAEKILNDKSLIQTTLYFDFYTFNALKKAGLGSEIIKLMDKWKSFIDAGLTTFPEHGIESRSDCHAWAAHPIYAYLNILCGISSVAPGFDSIIIEPQPGELKYMNGEMPHKKGFIKVLYNKYEHEEVFEIDIPKGVTAMFNYKSTSKTLKNGENKIIVRMK